MTEQIQLSLPLSETALRLGADFLASLAEHAGTIRDEARPIVTMVEPMTFGCVSEAIDSLPPVMASAGGDSTASLLNANQGNANDAFAIDAAADTPVAVAPPPPLQFETVVIGTERNPEYAGDLAAYELAALQESGWTDEALLENGYLREVTEQRPLVVAAGASAAPSAPAPGPANAQQVDADGMPWDSRIHSDAAEKMSAKGLWKRRKNTPDATWDAVRAEYGVGKSAAPAPATPAAPPAPSAPTPAAIAAPAPTPPPASSGPKFADFTKFMMANITAGKINQTDVTLAVQACGLTKIPDLQQREDLVPAVIAHLTQTKGL